MIHVDQPVVLANPRPAEDWDHRVCCDPDVALCGYRFPPSSEVSVPRDDARCCPICLAKERVHDRCSDPNCPGWPT